MVARRWGEQGMRSYCSMRVKVQLCSKSKFRALLYNIMSIVEKLELCTQKFVKRTDLMLSVLPTTKQNKATKGNSGKCGICLLCP